MYAADHELESINCFGYWGQLCSAYQDSYNDGDQSPKGPNVGPSELLEGAVCSSYPVCDLCTLCAEIRHRVTAANSDFQQLRRAIIYSSKALTLSVKTQLFQCIGMSMLLYSEDSWTVVGHISPLAVLQMNCLQRICGISLRDHVPNVDTLNRGNPLSVESQLQGKRLRWLGHVFRMPNNRLPEEVFF